MLVLASQPSGAEPQLLPSLQGPIFRTPKMHNIAVWYFRLVPAVAAIPERKAGSARAGRMQWFGV